jgi:hypothetical protein
VRPLAATITSVFGAVCIDVASTSVDTDDVVAVTDGWVEFESAMGCVAVADSVLPVVPFATVGIDIALTIIADPVLVAEPFASVGVDVALTVVVDPVLVIDPFAVVGVDVALTGVAVASVDSAKLCGKLSSDINSEGVGVDDVDSWCWSPYCAGSDATVSYWTVISPVLGS